MLKDRVNITAGGFQVKREANNEMKCVYYNIFELQDGFIEKTQENPVQYWDALNTYTQSIEKGKFVCVWEADTDGRTEEYSFYSSNGNAQPRIEWRIERAPDYGERACMITIEWKDNKYEPIHRSHIWLRHKKSNRKFNFLRETIRPLDRNAKIKRDQYIIVLPAKVEPEQLVIEADELLRQKYLLIH